MLKKLKNSGLKWKKKSSKTLQRFSFLDIFKNVQFSKAEIFVGKQRFQKLPHTILQRNVKKRRFCLLPSLFFTNFLCEKSVSNFGNAWKPKKRKKRIVFLNNGCFIT